MLKVSNHAAISGLDVKINLKIRFLVTSPDIDNSDLSKVTESEWRAMKEKWIDQKV
jgi:hypothetical protein